MTFTSYVHIYVQVSSVSKPLWQAFYWLVVWTPLKIWKSVGMMIPNIWEKHVPNHQPVYLSFNATSAWCDQALARTKPGASFHLEKLETHLMRVKQCHKTPINGRNTTYLWWFIVVLTTFMGFCESSREIVWKHDCESSVDCLVHLLNGHLVIFCSVFRHHKFYESLWLPNF